jgi:STE24 endopeptidase
LQAFLAAFSMHLALILAVLAALLSAEASPDVPVAGALGRLVGAAVAVAGVCLFAALSAGVTARRLADGTLHAGRLLRRYDRLRRLHLVVWLAAAAAILIGLDWGRLVRANWGLADAFLADELLILAPVLLPLVVSWAAFYEVDRAVGLAVGGADAAVPGRWAYLGLHVRHYLGIVLAPVLVMVAVQDAATRLCPQLVAEGREGLVLVPCLAAVILLFPLMLRYLWTTEELPPGPFRQNLEAAADRLGFRPSSIRVWRTGGMVANAAVAGFFQPLRYVFLSDGLLEELDPDELRAVLGHEAGHVYHRHLLLRVLAMLLPFCLWLTAAQLFPHTAGSLSGWLDGLGPSAGLPVGLVLLAGLAVYVVLAFGLFSRLLEHQADLFACRRLDPPPDRSDLEVLASALGKLVERQGRGARARSWQHASLDRRVAVVRRLIEDPGAERRFHRRIRWLGAGLVALVLSPGVAGLLGA